MFTAIPHKDKEQPMSKFGLEIVTDHAQVMEKTFQDLEYHYLLQQLYF